MNQRLPLALQTLVVISLFLVFLKLFAWDAGRRFARDDVMIQVGKEEMEDLNTPAVTICLKMEYVYKGLTEHWSANRTVWYQNVCNRTLQTVQHFYDCIEDVTMTQSEIIMTILSFSILNNSISLRTGDWVEIFRPFITAKCFTSKSFGKVDAMDTVLIKLNNTVGYRVYFHDPDVFFVSFNPSGLPRIEIGLDEGLSRPAFQYLSVKKHVLLERSSSPCRRYEEEQSSMISCIEMKIVNDSGCKVGPVHFTGEILIIILP